MTLQLNRRQLLESVAALGLAGALPAALAVVEEDGMQRVTAHLGSTYTITDYDTGLALMDFMVRSITPTSCPHVDFPHEPENGQYLAVSMTATTMPVPEELLEFVYPAFPWYSRTGGDELLASTAEAYLCYGGPFEVQPNTLYDLVLIADVPSGTRSLSYDGNIGHPGWEWRLG